MLKHLRYQIAKAYVGLKKYFLDDYYIRIAVQARYLYRQSELFRLRWQELGLDYAEQSFDDDLGGIGQYFFHKAQQSPWIVKRRIVADWLLGRPPQPYVISDV